MADTEREAERMKYAKTRCQAKCQGDWSPYPCSNTRSAAVDYQGRTGRVCSVHARQYAQWVARLGQQEAERMAHLRWRWRDFNKPKGVK